MHTESGLSEVLRQAADAAWELGVGAIGPEHLLLALASSSSASGRVLRASGLRYEVMLQNVKDRAPKPDQRTESEARRGPLELSGAVQRIVARAEGVALALGDTNVRDTHLLVAVLAERQSSTATQILESCDRAEALRQLAELGIVKLSTVLVRPAHWGAPVPVAEDDYLPLLAELQRKGTLYRTAQRDGQHYVWIADGPPD